VNFYKQGVYRALADLGFKAAAAPAMGKTELSGTPYPEKSPNINAERLAKTLQQEDDAPTKISPENGRRFDGDRPITWSAPTNLSGLDLGQGVSGMVLPLNQRA
jgi:hypothetical protein